MMFHIIKNVLQYIPCYLVTFQCDSCRHFLQIVDPFFEDLSFKKDKIWRSLTGWGVVIWLAKFSCLQHDQEKTFLFDTVRI
jgi:hypothetical protein